jgi:hypothetical protein
VPDHLGALQEVVEAPFDVVSHETEQLVAATNDCMINVTDMFYDASAFLDDDTCATPDDVVVADVPVTSVSSSCSSLPPWS